MEMARSACHTPRRCSDASCEQVLYFSHPATANYNAESKKLPREGMQMKKTLVLSASFVALLAMASLTLKASGNHNYDFSSDGRLVRVVNPSAATTAAPRVDSRYKLIAGNISAYPLAAFFSIFGNTVAQGGTNYPFQ